MKANLNKLSEYSDTELSLLVWLGAFGNGANRKAVLGSRFNAVQDLVEQQARTGICEPGKSIIDLEALKKAVKATYSDAADDLIKTIEKETK